MSEDAVTPRTRVHRIPQRASYDRALAHAILDEGLVRHVGFAVEGQPFVIPTAYGRNGDTLYLHGAAASRMLTTLAQGVAVCVTVTLLDGVVSARSTFHHSMNYRSVVVLGRAVEVTDPAERRAALDRIALVAQAPVADAHVPPGTAVPDGVARYARYARSR